MSTRHFCDWCGRDVTVRSYVGNRLRVRLSRYNQDAFRNESIEAEVIAGVNGTKNSGHLCRPCLLELLTTGEDIRP